MAFAVTEASQQGQAGQQGQAANPSSIEQRSWFIDNTVTKSLLSLAGLSQVSRVGGLEREVSVLLDPSRVAAYGVSAAEVSRQIRSTASEFSAGDVRISNQEQVLRADASLRSVAQLEALPSSPAMAAALLCGTLAASATG